MSDYRCARCGQHVWGDNDSKCPNGSDGQQHAPPLADASAFPTEATMLQIGVSPSGNPVMIGPLHVESAAGFRARAEARGIPIGEPDPSPGFYHRSPPLDEMAPSGGGVSGALFSALARSSDPLGRLEAIARGAAAEVHAGVLGWICERRVAAPDKERDDAALRAAGLKTLDEDYLGEVGKPRPQILDRVGARLRILLDGATDALDLPGAIPAGEEDPGTERANLALDALCRMWLAERARLG